MCIGLAGTLVCDELPAIRLPSILASPTTWNLLVGAVRPIPTLPLCNTVM